MNVYRIVKHNIICFTENETLMERDLLVSYIRETNSNEEKLYF